MAFRFTKPRDLEDRLERLAVEWDVDRASALILAALALVAVPLTRWRGGWIVPATLQALALLRFLGAGPDPVGWLLRPFGFRARDAIETEAGLVRTMRAQHAPEPTPTRSGLVGTPPPGALPSGEPPAPPTPPLGEELRPMEAPTVSGPSGEWPPRGGLQCARSSC